MQDKKLEAVEVVETIDKSRNLFFSSFHINMGNNFWCGLKKSRIEYAKKYFYYKNLVMEKVNMNSPPS